jgi:hypothetical protein
MLIVYERRYHMDNDLNPEHDCQMVNRLLEALWVVATKPSPFESMEDFWNHLAACERLLKDHYPMAVSAARSAARQERARCAQVAEFAQVGATLLDRDNMPDRAERVAVVVASRIRALPD